MPKLLKLISIITITAACAFFIYFMFVYENYRNNELLNENFYLILSRYGDGDMSYRSSDGSNIYIDYSDNIRPEIERLRPDTNSRCLYNVLHLNVEGQWRYTSQDIEFEIFSIKRHSSVDVNGNIMKEFYRSMSLNDISLDRICLIDIVSGV